MDATPVSPSAAFISSASKSYGKLCCGRSFSPLPMGLKTKYKDSVFDRAFMSLFARKIANVTGISGNINGYEDFVDVSREVMKGRNPAQQKEAIHKVLFSILPSGAPETEDDLRARCHKSWSVVDKERFKEVSFLPNELTEKISVLQATKQNEDKAIIPVETASAAALALAVAGLISCSQAWAGPEIVSVQDAASWLGDLDDIKSGFLSAFLLIFFSEIGDKTFFIAAVLASRKSNAAVFTGTFGALVAMTFISVFLGRTFHYIDGIVPFSLGENELPLDDLAAVILLVYFGISTLLEAASMEGSKAEEEQQEAELAIAGLGANGEGSAITNTALATFGLVFVAEWGDKSFFSTVALSAASSPVGVVSGAIAGHGVATLLAVLGGSFLSSYISEKVTAYIGGSLFLVFAAFTLYEIVS